VSCLLVLTNVGLEVLREIRMEVICGKDVVVGRCGVRNSTKKEEVKSNNRNSKDIGMNQWQYSR
jgi:hypothetical protein